MFWCVCVLGTFQHNDEDSVFDCITIKESYKLGLKFDMFLAYA